MGLEVGDYIDDLVITNPDGSADSIKYGDDHLRFIKKAVKQTFPGFAGRFNRIVSKTSAYTIVAADNSVIFSVTNTWTLTLTAAATIGNGFVVGIYNGGTGTITIDPNASETINGVSNIALAAGRVAYLRCTGTGWIADHALISDNYADTGKANDFSDIVTFQKGIGPMHLQNCRFVASVGSNAITLALKTKDGSDPSTTSKVDIGFRSATLTSTEYNIRQITSALNIVVPATATLGFGNSETGYVALYAIDNAGTVELAVAGSIHDQTLFQPESARVSTTALDTASDASCKLYSDTARSNVPCRFLGMIKIQTGATAGNWSNSPTEQNMVANVKRFGSRRVLLTSSGTFYVPMGITELYVTAVGGGGGGGGGAGGWASSDTSSGGGAGGGPGFVNRGLLSVTPGDSISVTIGAAGVGGNGGVSGGGTGANGTDGEDTIFSTITAPGGKAGTGGKNAIASAGEGGDAGHSYGAATSQTDTYRGYQAVGGDGEPGPASGSAYGGAGGAGGSNFQDPGGDGAARETTVNAVGNDGGDGAGYGSGGGGGSGVRYGNYAGGVGGDAVAGCVLVEW